MSRRLVENITSDYLEAAAAMAVAAERNRVVVYVEGYDDIPFWRNIFDLYESPAHRFEITTPVRNDFAKGKKVVLGFAPQAGPRLLLCVDSDFDHIFPDQSSVSRTMRDSPWVLQTYAYAIENYLCYPPSLHSVCTRATKCDARIFDFEGFMADYSRIVFPVFVWYAYAARVDRPSFFTLTDFRNTVRLNYLNLDEGGEETLAWLRRQVDKRLKILSSKNKRWIPEIEKQRAELLAKGIKPEQTHLYMQGHALMDNVVSVIVATVCSALRKICIDKIMSGSQRGMTQSNELSYYNNSLSDYTELLSTNTGYHGCHLYKLLEADIERILRQRDEKSSH